MKDINLLPEEIKSTTNYTPGNTKSGSPVKAIITGVFVLVVIGATLLAPKFYITSLQSSLDTINKEIESAKYDPVREVNAALDEVNGLISSKGDIMNTIDSVSYPVNEVLISLNSVIPQGCQITQLSYNSNKINIGGIASDRMVVADFLGRLQRLEFLSAVGNVSIDKANVFNLSIEVGAKNADGKAGE